ncbi:MAG: endonuclease G [Saprospiraceae bacterium]|jgi:endonuclease G
MSKNLIFLLFALIPFVLFSQPPQESLTELESQLSEIEKSRKLLSNKINQQKWSIYKDDLKSYGFPSANFQEHTAYIFEYSEEHEQSKWVAHMITSEVEELGTGRTNDFRVDPLVTTGTAEQDDYFNYYPTKKKGEQYDGFGYDRGHLAPSADFRWCGEAVSESYFYSNMSPQHPDLNQKKWSELESMLRGYVIRNNVPLAIITAPVLKGGLPKIKQSPNGLSIPEFYLKIAYDHTNQRAIGFLMANKELTKPLDMYTISVDDLEKLTGYNYFPHIDQSLESSYNIKDWFSEYDKGSVEPIKQNKLPRGHYNTETVARQMNKYRKVKVCGKVVSARNSRKGHAWINLDRKYPNDYFSVMIYKEELTNFTYDPVKHFKDEKICVEGEIGKIGNKPVAKISNPKRISFMK